MNIQDKYGGSLSLIFLFFSHSQDPTSAKRKIMQCDYTLLKSAKNVTTRSTVDCLCSICDIGRMNGLEYKKYLQTKPVPGRPCNVEKPVAEKLVLCNLCLTQIGKGLPHDCHNTSLKENIHDIVQNCPTKLQEQIASNLLKNIGNLHEGNGAVAKLSTGGKAVSYTHLTLPTKA